MWRILDYGKHSLDEVLDMLEFYVRLGFKVISVTAAANPKIAIVVDFPLLGTT